MPHISRNTEDPHTFRVQSFTRAEVYTVTLPANRVHWHTATCTCPQHQARRISCKHIAAVIQRLCELAPLAIEIPITQQALVWDLAGETLTRAAHEPFCTVASDLRTVAIDVILFYPALSRRVLQPAPTHNDIVAALIGSEPFTLSRGIAYGADGRTIAVDCDPLALGLTHMSSSRMSYHLSA